MIITSNCLEYKKQYKNVILAKLV